MNDGKTVLFAIGNNLCFHAFFSFPDSLHESSSCSDSSSRLVPSVGGAGGSISSAGSVSLGTTITGKIF